jgi:ATP-dependent Clp protease ATP-binding subunit ClpX
MGFLNDWRKLQCSFCGKRDDTVKKLIAGPQVFICNACVNICLEILVDDARTTGATSVALFGGS